MSLLVSELLIWQFIIAGVLSYSARHPSPLPRGTTEACCDFTYTPHPPVPPQGSGYSLTLHVTDAKINVLYIVD